MGTGSCVATTRHVPRLGAHNWIQAVTDLAYESAELNDSAINWPTNNKRNRCATQRLHTPPENLTVPESGFLRRY